MKTRVQVSLQVFLRVGNLRLERELAYSGSIKEYKKTCSGVISKYGKTYSGTINKYGKIYFGVL